MPELLSQVHVSYRPWSMLVDNGIKIVVLNCSSNLENVVALETVVCESSVSLRNCAI